MNIDIVLINPPYIEKKGNIWKEIASCLPPLGLASVAAYLEKKGLAVKIIDAEALRLSIKEILQSALSVNSRWIGITSVTPTIYTAIEIANKIKSVCPEKEIVFGGVHASILPESVLSESVDYVVKGEGEETLFELLSGKPVEKILGLSYKKNGKIYHAPERNTFLDLNQLPFPSYHLLPMHRYYPARGSYKRLPAISALVSRGCPGRCTFCYGDRLGKRIRMLSSERIIELIKMLQKNYGIKEISFYDDTFTSNRNIVQDFCEKIINEKIDLTWSCFSRVDFIDKETLRLMKLSGCHQICYGIESGDEQILKNLGKYFSLEKAYNIINFTKNLGIEARATFMLGNPGETKETLNKTLKFCLKLDPDVVVFNITTPYPGTKMYKWAEENNCLLTKNWSEFDVATVVMKLPNLTPKYIRNFYKKAYYKFYFRPKFIWKRIKKIRSLRNLYEGLKGIIGLQQTIFSRR